MRIGKPAIEAVAADRERSRLQVQVDYDSAGLAPEKYWFEIPAALADDLDRSGNAWLAALLPLAASLGEPVEWEAPVDRPLVEGAREVLRVWRAWYGETRIVALNGPLTEKPPSTLPNLTCAYLSGGVDSFFTALDHGDGDARDERGPIDEFLFVAGMDLRLDATEGIERARRSVLQAAEELGHPLVFLRTNLRERETLWNRNVHWGHWGHGAVLAAMPHALGRRYRQVLIPASNMYLHLVPWGSHPFTDSLFSSWTLRVRDDGAAQDRAEKVRAIAGNPVVRRHLRVCFKSNDGGNCGRCEKCLITMLMLETLVGLSRCPTFPASLDGRRLRALPLDKPWHKRYLRQLREFAVEGRRPDVVRTIDFMLGWRGRARHALRATMASLFGRKAVARRGGRRATALARPPAPATTSTEVTGNPKTT